MAFQLFVREYPQRVLDPPVRQHMLGLQERLTRALGEMDKSDKVPLRIISDGDTRLILGMLEHLLETSNGPAL